MYLSLVKFFLIVNSTLGGFIQIPSLRLYKRHSSINLYNDNKNKSLIYKISFNNPVDDENNYNLLTKFRIYTGLNIILFLYYFYLNNYN
jgi:hypothetical protein